MILLNLGCGDMRPSAPWINVDNLWNVLDPDGPARSNLNREPNYVNCDLSRTPWPWSDCTIDGILMSHFLEHLDALEAKRALRECFRMLKDGGVLRVSVPDATVFRDNYPYDNAANAIKLFGEPLADPNFDTFMGWALFFHEHKQVFTEDSLWCSLVDAGFDYTRVMLTRRRHGAMPGHYCNQELSKLDNRADFSVYMEAYK